MDTPGSVEIQGVQRATSRAQQSYAGGQGSSHRVCRLLSASSTVREYADMGYVVCLELWLLLYTVAIFHI